MIHPMWAEFAKVALRVQLSGPNEEAEAVDDPAFKSFAALASSEAADIADAMCAEYDKRNKPAEPFRDGSSA